MRPILTIPVPQGVAAAKQPFPSPPPPPSLDSTGPRHGTATLQSRRAAQEDTIVVVPDMFSDGGRVTLYALFDGHGGAFASSWLRSHFAPTLMHVWNGGADIAQSLRLAFRQCDNDVLAAERSWMRERCARDPFAHYYSPSDPSTSGSTAVVLLVTPDRLYVAHVGDSEALLVDLEQPIAESARPLTPMHRPDVEEEMRRIETAGGYVFASRVQGTLAVSRAFGDGFYKTPLCLVTAEPTIRVIDRCPTHRWMVVLASDGLWDVCTHDEVAVRVAAAATGFPRDDATRPWLDRCAQALVEEAVHQRHSGDNTTAIVVSLLPS